MSEPREEAERFDPQAIQERWLPVWDSLELYKAGSKPELPKKYILDMFPYPSGDLHMGHAEAFSIGDVIARYWFARGYDVLHPIGWDAFGLPAENAAIKRGEYPSKWTYANIETQAESFKRFAISFDFSRRLNTCDPEYYRWTQWLFLRFYEKGLAYRKQSPVNWCPNDQTVLANEQVVAGRCERCDAVVTKRNLTQWYFKITDYAERLLDDMALVDWPERVLTMQRNWIGKSTGAHVDFRIDGRDEPVTVFTTRPDTLWGATFFVVAVDAGLADELCAPEYREAFEAYRDQVKLLSDIDRQATDREKTGVFLGRYAINPVTEEAIPVWAADYVLADYGTGAIMAVPAHDQRDLEFAQKFGLDIKVVIDTGDAHPGETGTATAGDGMIVNSGPLDGLDKAAGIARAIELLEANTDGKGAITYRLRDWLLSRQRFWGAPIPIIHCPSCGEVAVPDDQLPVRLPETDFDLKPKGESPLASAHDWVKVDCPKCGGQATRDTDTMDTFVDSSWYFFRYCSPHYTEGPFDPEAVREWMPVARYVGGVEHAILHLLYARFFTKVIHDLGMIDFVEPFTAYTAQGSVILNGAAMSKSKGNMVELGAELTAHGVDAIRTTMLFASPPEDDVDWADVSPTGQGKWLARVWRIAGDVGAAGAPHHGEGDQELLKTVHKIIDDVTRLVEGFRFNVAIARLMELTNALRKAIDSGAGPNDKAVCFGAFSLAIMLAPFAPYTAEECWSRLGKDPSVHQQRWPVADPAYLVEDTVTCIVQIMGKIRDRLEVPPDISEADLRALAEASDAVQKALEGKPIKQAIVRPPKVVNFVV